MADTVYANQDTFVDSGYPTVNHNGDNNLQVYNGGVNDSYFTLLGFDLSAYAGMTITSATLNMYAFEVESANIKYGIKRITSTWAEATVTYATRPSIDAEVYFSGTKSGTYPAWKVFDVTSLVQDVADGATFYGIWVYSVDNESYYWTGFDDESSNDVYLSITAAPSEVIVNATTATVTGNALAPTTADIVVDPVIATMTGNALAPTTADIVVNATTVTATGNALAPTISAVVVAETATMTGEALIVVGTTLDIIYINQDTYIYSYFESVDTNYNDVGHLDVYNGGVADSIFTLLGFDVSAYTGMTIVSATLYMYASDIDSVNLVYGIKRITGAWDESTVTYTTRPSIDAEVYFSGTKTADAPEWKTFDITSLIQDVADGATFYGIWVYSVDDESWFATRFNDETGNDAYLMIEAVPPIIVIAETAIVTGEALVPTTADITVVATIATITGEALVPTTADIVVVATTATATGEALAPSITIVYGTIATATCEALIPTTADIVVVATTATMTGEAQIPSITIVYGAIATAIGDALVPTTADIVVVATTATITGEALVPTTIGIVYAVTATMTGETLTQASIGAGEYTILAVQTPNNIFVNGGYEFFTFELLSLSNGAYVHNSWITDYVVANTCNINFDFTREICGDVSFIIRNHPTINYLSDLVKVYYNIIVDDVTYSYPLGAYMLSTPNINYTGSIVERRIQGYDLSLALQQDTTLNSYAIASGTNVVTAVQTLLDSVGTWVKYNIAPNSDTLTQDIAYELGRSKLFIINSLLGMINYYPLWCTGNGVYKSIPWVDTENISYEFIDNEQSLYEPDINIDTNYADLYNRVVVITNQMATDTPPLYKIWSMEDEGLQIHPFSYTNIARYVTKKFDSDSVSQDYVDSRARRELRKMLEIEEAINYQHAYVSSRVDDGLPWHGDAFRFKNTTLDIDSVYLIESQKIALNTGTTVESVIRRVRDF